MKIYKCDRCGKTCYACDTPEVKVNDRTYAVTFVQHGTRVMDYQLDLCGDCCRALESWWMGGLK